MEMKLSQAFMVAVVTQSLPVVLDPNGKSQERQMLEIAANSIMINYLEAPAEEKRELLNMLSAKVSETLKLVQATQDLLQAELNKLDTPLSLDKT